MPRNPSESCILKNVKSHFNPNRTILAMEGTVVMPTSPENTYFGDGTVLDRNVDADCCSRCPLKGTSFTRSKLLMKDGKPVPAKCTGWELSYTSDGDIVRERGSAYISKRELDVVATLTFKSEQERDSYMATCNNRYVLKNARRIPSVAHDIVPRSLPCGPGSSLRRVKVFAKHNPPRVLQFT